MSEIKLRNEQRFNETIINCSESQQTEANNSDSSVSSSEPLRALGGSGVALNFKVSLDRQADAKSGDEVLSHQELHRSEELMKKQTDTREEKTANELSAYARENRGEFHVTRDACGRPATIEGWLSFREGKRPNSDGSVQQQFRTEHGLLSNQDAFHVIGYEHGGPTVAKHGKEKTVDNLVAGDERMNRSYHKCFENQITNDLKAGKEIYCHALIEYRDCPPGSRDARGITYSFFTCGATGELQSHSMSAYYVRAGERPENQKKSSEVLREAGDKGFYSKSDPKQNEWIH